MAQEKKVTIKDVARDAGVGLGTVSRAINGSANISLETKQKIFESIKKLGYVPNQTAQSMRSNKYRSIALFVNISNVAFAQIAKGIQNELDYSGYTLSLCDVGERDAAGKIDSFLAGRKFDGIILSVPREDDEQLHKVLSKVSVPIVTLDRDVPGVAGGVVIDYSHSVKRATEYLLSLGHEGIALISGSGKIRPTRISVAAFKEAYEAAGKKLDSARIIEGGFTSDIGRNVMLDLLPDIQRGSVTAVISLNNQMFHGILQVMRENGLEYPKDLSIITVEDYELTKLLNPPVTVIRRPLLDIGAGVARVLLQYIEKPDMYGKQNPLSIPTEFIIRESCSKR
ncbi:LacI family DNA-binding transcriptional regulator [Paenibacillus ginsengihumi]|uniref:LacI family DNA-binding transcriptional regulator n=1 Tax=Paenibacillus ginsengihumi TaxID=431596 RepID=UPI0003718EDA|nr:LacI family DNA-binding transcriptional regulator [Paenibacillus ginsengihumi]